MSIRVSNLTRTGLRGNQVTLSVEKFGQKEERKGFKYEQV